VSNLAHLDPATYVASHLHCSGRVFLETNCYTDLWIELLHAHALEPVAMMAFCLTVDFEGDQWTFFKPLASDLELLYGIDVHEMQLYRPLVDHIHDQLIRGRSMIIEVDAFYLPDTVGVSYNQVHQKTAIAVVGLDRLSERLVYFHGRGLHKITGRDFRNALGVRSTVAPDVLPPYAELVRFDAGHPLAGSALHAAACEILDRQLKRLPSKNPWLMFGEWLAAELPAIISSPIEHYHACAFATVRQAGAAFELAQSFIDWALAGNPAANTASAALERQVEGAKVLLLKLARRRVFDTAKTIEPLAAAYSEAIGSLKSALNRNG
jgi:Domain of unknown function (DUF1839)